MLTSDVRGWMRPERRAGLVRLLLLLPVLLVLGLGSCSGMDPLLSSHPIGPNNTTPVGGTSYYLPKVLLKVQVWSYVHSEQARGPDGKPMYKEDGSQMTSLSKRHFAVHKKDGSDEVIIPDHRHQFVISPDWDAASYDYVEIQMSPEGLLDAVHGDARDERADIAAGLTDLATMLIAGPGSKSKWDGGGRDRPGPVRGLTDEVNVPRFVAEYEFDPVDPVDRARIQKALAGYSPGIKMSLTKQADCPTATSGADCANSCNCTKPGIYYRLPIPYRISFAPAGRYRQPGGPDGYNTAGEWEYLEGGMERTVLLPNEALCVYAPVSRASFVTSHTLLDFESGMLVKVEVDKPSELLGFVRIPVDAASAILAIPAELLTIRINRTNQISNLDSARSAQMEAEQRRLETQLQLLEAARKARGGADIEGGGGDSDLYPR